MIAHYHVFSSHSSLDDHLAGDVKALLEHNHINVFCTPTSIQSGKWEPQIEDALQNSDELWVLLTPNALAQSVWVHQELGYFYGYGHGTGSDDLGTHSHYLYQEGTPQPGLYAQLQGTTIKDIGNPIEVAATIAADLGKATEIPSDWENRVYETHGQETDTDDELYQNERSGFSSELVSKIRGMGLCN